MDQLNDLSHDLLQKWITYVFDHKVDDIRAKWYWSDEAPEWDGERQQIPVLIAETFERAGELLAGFPDEQMDQGF